MASDKNAQSEIATLARLVETSAKALCEKRAELNKAREVLCGMEETAEMALAEYRKNKEALDRAISSLATG